MECGNHDERPEGRPAESDVPASKSPESALLDKFVAATVRASDWTGWLEPPAQRSISPASTLDELTPTAEAEADESPSPPGEEPQIEDRYHHDLAAPGIGINARYWVPEAAEAEPAAPAAAGDPVAPEAVSKLDGVQPGAPLPRRVPGDRVNAAGSIRNPVSLRPGAEPTEPEDQADTPGATNGRSVTSSRAQASMTSSDRECIEDWGKVFELSRDMGRKEEAAEGIWTRAATVVAREVTGERARRELRNGLELWIWHGLPQGAVPEERRAMVERFLNAAQGLVTATLNDLAADVLAELTRGALVERVVPGIRVALPPTGLVDAIFTACELLQPLAPAHPTLLTG
jgi:hypothetical protein